MLSAFRFCRSTGHAGRLLIVALFLSGIATPLTCTATAGKIGAAAVGQSDTAPADARHTAGGVTPPPAQPDVTTPPQSPRHLEDAPKPSFFIAPGVQGIFAQLREKQRTDGNGRGGAQGNRGGKPPKRVPYKPYRAIDTPADAAHFNLRQIVVKFVEGSDVRLRERVLVTVASGAKSPTEKRAARVAPNEPGIADDVAAIVKQIKVVGGVVGRAAPAIKEDDLARLRQEAERRSRFDQADPNLFFFVHLPKKVKPQQAARVLAALRQHKSVETTYFQPIPVNAVDKAPTTSIDVTNAQGYFRAAPTGIDVDFARFVPGGLGAGVRIADIEGGWFTGHEDLPAMSFGFGVNWGDNHGTAVMGEIVGEMNAFGGTGIAPGAMIGFSSVTNLDPLQGPIFFYSVANALLNTGLVLRAGDIALIEQHFPFPAGACLNGCNCGQFGFVAVETFPFEHAAISLLTSAGIIVVEAAGNGQTMVTPASSSDSGAIVVGASNTALAPACFTNFGPRVNVHAWGMGIGTNGYGGPTGGPADATLRANGADVEQWYTRGFGGTSGASPIVVGAAAVIQSTRAAVGLGPLSPLAMRALLMTTGTPQVPGSAPNIGPLPDLRAAIATYIPDAARFVAQSPLAPGALAPGAAFSVAETFQNTGGRSWTGDHTLAIAPSQTTPPVFTPQSVALGTAALPINPTQSTTRTFALQAPLQPGNYPLTFVLRDLSGSFLAASPPLQVVVAVANTPFDNAVVTVVSAPGSLVKQTPGTVTVTAANTGTSTWTPANYLLKLGRGLRMALPQQTVPLAANVLPGQSVTLTFAIQCNGTGQGFFTAQMSGPGGVFGTQGSRTVVCQP